MAYWTFTQNNSGGSFTFDVGSGITAYVIVEATDVAHAKERAEQIGLYFDGCDKGMDCGCCGDRWYAPYKEAGSPFPEYYGSNVRTAKPTGEKGWMKAGYEICVHPISGPLEWFDPVELDAGE